jgi:hypothetical protein
MSGESVSSEQARRPASWAPRHFVSQSLSLREGFEYSMFQVSSWVARGFSGSYRKSVRYSSLCRLVS